MKESETKSPTSQLQFSSHISDHNGRVYENPEMPPEESATAPKGERALWRAVITQALMDAGSLSKKREMKFDRAQAISWLSGTSADFHAVCYLAGFDPSYVMTKAKEAIARGCVWREDVKAATKGYKPKYKAKRKKKAKLAINKHSETDTMEIKSAWANTDSCNAIVLHFRPLTHVA